MEASSRNSSRSLRNLYFVRTAFQVVWATTVITTAHANPQVGAVLFILYPLWDVACTVYDLNTSSQSGNTRTSQRINALLGVVASIGIGLTVFGHPVYAVAVFGTWAFAAGMLQLVAAMTRRKEAFGGQWAMILSGAQSTVAGVAYFVGGLLDKRHIKDVGGYATFGAVYFLISGILIARKLSKGALTEVTT